MLGIGSGRYGLTDVLTHLSNPRTDSQVVRFMRGITALELAAKKEFYRTFIPGIDAYG